MTYTFYTNLMRNSRVIAIGMALLCIALCEGYVETLDFRSYEVEQVEKEAQRKKDSETFKRGNREDATEQEKAEAHEAFVRNTD